MFVAMYITNKDANVIGTFRNRNEPCYAYWIIIQILNQKKALKHIHLKLTWKSCSQMFFILHSAVSSFTEKAVELER